MLTWMQNGTGCITHFSESLHPCIIEYSASTLHICNCKYVQHKGIHIHQSGIQISLQAFLQAEQIFLHVHFIITLTCITRLPLVATAVATATLLRYNNAVSAFSIPVDRPSLIERWTRDYSVTLTWAIILMRAVHMKARRAPRSLQSTSADRDEQKRKGPSILPDLNWPDLMLNSNTDCYHSLSALTTELCQCSEECHGPQIFTSFSFQTCTTASTFLYEGVSRQSSLNHMSKHLNYWWTAAECKASFGWPATVKV